MVQIYIGDGAKMVADAFALAKEKKSTIIFINELDVVGEKWGRTEGEALESIAICLNFLTNSMNLLKTMTSKSSQPNRPDILDPALLRSGRLDNKIELPLRNKEAKIKIM